MSAERLVPLLRELFGREPHYRAKKPWELSWLLYSLRYSNRLEDEGEIEVAQEVALGDDEADGRAA